MKTFDQLVRIKAFREEKAERAMHAQRRVLAKAQAQRDAAGRCLDEFRDQARAHEQRIYRDLCERVVRLHHIEDVRAQVLTLRGQEKERERELQTAETRRDEEERRLDVDRQAHAHARRMHDKFVEVADMFALETRQQAERQEEAEIEEAAESRGPRGEWQ
jgi:type III secretion protein O